MLSLNSVTSIRATNEPNVYLVNCNITDLNGETYDTDYGSRPEDTFGLNPTIRQWLADNAGSYDILPYVAPTEEELRAAMQPISARQLRLTLVRNGYTLSSVDAAIAALPEGQIKEEAKIEWEYATTFTRLSPALLVVADALSISPEEVDTMWTEALAI
jgi:hypothetical protein